MSETRRRVLPAGLLLFLLACGGAHAPPAAEDPKAPAPDLTGQTVMVLPVQPGGGAPLAELDAEIAFWLGERAPRVRWVFPAELDRILARSPALDIRLRELAVGSFGRAAVKRIGDPLYGDLRRLGAIVNARYAILPVAAGTVAAGTGTRVELAAAVVDTFDGAVLWFGVVGGDVAPAGPEATAGAARALARALFP